MMKVYDMVTYGMYAPDETTPPYAYETHPNEVPALGLQTVQEALAPRPSTLPPSLRSVDIEAFLESCSD